MYVIPELVGDPEVDFQEHRVPDAHGRSLGKPPKVRYDTSVFYCLSMPNILLTHERPHLDDVCGIWLYRRYVPGWKHAQVKFLMLKGGGAAVTWKGKPADDDAHVVHVGVGKGKYDEHKGDVGKCAALLVYEDLKRRKLIPAKDRAALDRMLEFVVKEDTGQLMGLEYRSFSLPSLLRAIPNSDRAMELGFELLEAVMPRLEDEAQLEKDWKRRIEIETPKGKGIALKSSSHNVEGKAYPLGFTFVIQIEPKHGWRMLRAAPDAKIDFAALSETVRALEPKTSWFLHHTKKMLLNGSTSAPHVVKSRLSLEKLVDLLKDSVK